MFAWRLCAPPLCASQIELAGERLAPLQEKRVLEHLEIASDLSPQIFTMTKTKSDSTSRWMLTGMGIALGIGVFLSPFASKNPDGLDRVAIDLKFEDKAVAEAPAHKLPFYAVFDEYALRGVPEAVATPLAGLVGTLATFGIAWGIGKICVRKPHRS